MLSNILIFLGMHSLIAVLMIVAVMKAGRGKFPFGWFVFAVIMAGLANAGAILQYRAQGGHDWPQPYLISMIADGILLLAGAAFCAARCMHYAREQRIWSDAPVPVSRRGGALEVFLKVIGVMGILCFCAAPFLYARTSLAWDEIDAIHATQALMDAVFKEDFSAAAKWTQKSEQELRDEYDTAIQEAVGQQKAEMEEVLPDIAEDELVRYTKDLMGACRYEVTDAERTDNGFLVTIRMDSMKMPVSPEKIRAHLQPLLEEADTEGMHLTAATRPEYENMLAQARWQTLREAVQDVEYGTAEELQFLLEPDEAGRYDVSDDAVFQAFENIISVEDADPEKLEEVNDWFWEEAEWTEEDAGKAAEAYLQAVFKGDPSEAAKWAGKPEEEIMTLTDGISAFMNGDYISSILDGDETAEYITGEDMERFVTNLLKVSTWEINGVKKEEDGFLADCDFYSIDADIQPDMIAGYIQETLENYKDQEPKFRPWSSGENIVVRCLLLALSDAYAAGSVQYGDRHSTELRMGQTMPHIYQLPETQGEIIDLYQFVLDQCYGSEFSDMDPAESGMRESFAEAIEKTGLYKDSPYVGTWRMAKIETADNFQELSAGDSHPAVFREDGTYTFPTNESAEDGIWEETEDGILIDLDIPAAYRDGCLILEEDGTIYTYVKEEPQAGTDSGRTENARGQGSLWNIKLQDAPEAAADTDPVSYDTLESYRMEFHMDTDYSISALGDTMDFQIKTDMNFDATVSPERMKGKATYANNEGSLDSIMYVEDAGDEYVLYISVDDGQTWSKEITPDNILPGGEKSQIATFRELAEDALTMPAVGTETIHGREAVIYSGVLTEDQVQEYFSDGTAVSSMLSTAGINAELDTGSLGEMPAVFALDAQSGILLRYELDMSQCLSNMTDQLMESALRNSLEEEGFSGDLDMNSLNVRTEVRKAVLQVIVYDLNEVGEITMPDV